MADENPALVRARIIHYRQLLQEVDDDPELRRALEELIRLTNEKLAGLDRKP